MKNFETWRRIWISLNLAVIILVPSGILYAQYELRKAIKIQFDKVVRELNAVETKKVKSPPAVYPKSQ